MNQFSRIACSLMAKAKNRNKYSRVGLHSERDNWLLTGAFADSTELLHTENKFILNKFLTLCGGCIFYIRSAK